ncbi:pentatricopeptide repeat-containing protein At1g76280 isoform X2 [Malania oleifera]|uniref:pentatricopeptide repeat-containing protein At1g76280 isoform X2 n=1 Tax=Malania oleifera TaxID=397392 RepID=UPI0025AEBBD8|nr:pentatricopeptide repeat-containing protein At1g76280 isoform X2 [Malania oleifera]
MQVQIVNALRLGARSKASHLLSDLSRGNNLLRAADFVHILEYCMNSPDPPFVMETWRHMEERKISMSPRCYTLIFRALCKGGYLEEAFNLINFLGENHGVYPILPLYNSFLRSCTQMRSHVHANLCLDLMEHRLMGKNEVTYWELLKLAVWQQNVSATHEIWKEYIKYYSLSTISLRKFIWSFTRLGDLQAAYETLQHMVAVAHKGSDLMNKTAEGKLSVSRLDIPIPTNGVLKKCSMEKNEQSMPSIFENCKKMDTCFVDSEYCAMVGVGSREAMSLGMRMLERKKGRLAMKVLRWAFSDVIYACAQSQTCGMAEQLILQLKVMKQRNLKPYDSTLATLAIGCSEVLELDLAGALLEQISETSYAQPYNAYIAACDTLGQPERAMWILAKMKQLKIKPDIRTYELLFSLFGTVNAPYEEGNILSQVDAEKRINAIEMDMVRNCIQHSHLSIKNKLKALGAEGMVKEMIQLLRLMDNQFSLSNTYLGTSLYNTVLHSLVEAKESSTAIELFKKMKSRGILFDAATYNIMIDCCSTIKCFKSASALVSMMVRDGFFPETVTYTALIKILLGYEYFNEALNLLDQARLEGIKPDLLLFNTILREACMKGRIDVVEFIVKQMHEEKIQPDPSTCSYVFTAYVASGFHRTAMEALQVLSMRMISEEESMLEEKKSEYEDLILAEDLEAESRILQLFKCSKDNMAIALLNLRWCAMVGISISWLPNQSLWARRLSGGCSS